MRPSPIRVVSRRPYHAVQSPPLWEEDGSHTGRRWGNVDAGKAFIDRGWARGWGNLGKTHVQCALGSAVQRAVRAMTTAAESRFAAPIAAPRLVSALPSTTITPRIAPAVERRRLWQRRYRRRLLLADLAVVLLSVGIATWIQLDAVAQLALGDVGDAPWQYLRVSLVTTVIWLTLLAMFQTRATSITGHGSTEYRRVVQATALAFGVLAIGFIILQSQGVRTQLLIALPVGITGLLVGRWMSRRWLVRQRETGEYVSRAVVVGTRTDVEYVARTVRGSGISGYRVVGVVLDDSDARSIAVGDQSIRAFGSVNTVSGVAEELGADAVIVASTRTDDPDYVKRLAWQLEGTAAELVLSSPLTDVAGPRMTLKPVEGLPLIQVEIPTFEGARYAIKRTMDIIVAATALIGIGLITPFIALAIKLDSHGTVFFRQERVGRDGRIFRMVKFRSMGMDAEARKAELAAQNEGSGLLFKMKAPTRA